MQPLATISKLKLPLDRPASTTAPTTPTTTTAHPYRAISTPRLRRRDIDHNTTMEGSAAGGDSRMRRNSSSAAALATPTKKSGLFGASSNLVNSIVGAGIIGIPYALNQAGLIVGVALLVAVAYSTDKSLRMLIELASFHPQLRHCNVKTYEDLARIPFGSIGSNCVLAAMFIMAYGAMVAYLLIIKDTIPVVLGLGDSFWSREFVMTVSSALFILPLALLRDMSALACTSLLSVTGDAILVGLIMLYSPFVSTVAENGGLGRVIIDYWFDTRLFIGLGVLSTAMACQHSAFLISGSLERPTPQRWAVVTGRSLTVAGLMSVTLGVFGYLGYLDATEGNVLNNFPRGSVAVNGGRALLGKFTSAKALSLL
jgi:solute carrier family 38 (sodium-coupled neutral amino acid transporter), member 11